MSLEDPISSELQEEGVGLLLECIAKKPRTEIEVEAVFQLGHLYYKQGRMGNAEERLLQALRMDGQHIGALYDLGQVCMHQERPAAAKEHFRRVLTIAPSHESAGEWIQIIENLESDDT
jgi:tetratricopeptide (TPR) repeat protein